MTWSLRAQGQARWPQADWVSAEALCGRQNDSPRGWWASLVALTVKNLPATQENQVQSLGQEEPLEKGMATHSSLLAWKIPWTEEPGGL